MKNSCGDKEIVGDIPFSTSRNTLQVKTFLPLIKRFALIRKLYRQFTLFQSARTVNILNSVRTEMQFGSVCSVYDTTWWTRNGERERERETNTGHCDLVLQVYPSFSS